MKTAKKWNEIETGKTTPEVIKDPYIQAFANTLMNFSNDLQTRSLKKKEVVNEYMPAIREFIANVTGL